MAEQKTKPTTESVSDFINKQEDEQVRDDCRELVKMMKRITGEPATMWGPGIVGFGSYHYKYDSGHEGDSCIAAFAPRKGKLTVYGMPEVLADATLMSKLGKAKSSKACIYFKKLEDIDTSVLEQVIKKSVELCKKKYPG